MITYTDFVEKAETRFKMGWVGIGIISINLTVNLVLIFRDVIREVKKGYWKMKIAICEYAIASPILKSWDCCDCIPTPRNRRRYAEPEPEPEVPKIKVKV
jgi:hypothetical protein